MLDLEVSVWNRIPWRINKFHVADLLFLYSSGLSMFSGGIEKDHWHKMSWPFKRQPHKIFKLIQTIRWQFADKLFECAWPFCGLKWFICCCETGVSLLQTVYPLSKSFFWGCLSLCVCLSVAASSFRGKFDFSLWISVVGRKQC